MGHMFHLTMWKTERVSVLYLKAEFRKKPCSVKTLKMALLT